MNSYLTAEPQEMEVELKTLESTKLLTAFTSCDSRSSNQMANATTANFT